MTTQQIIGLVLVGGLIAWNYMPAIKMPTFPSQTQDPLLTHIKAICRVRDEYKTPEVNAACNALLEVLLEVKT